MTAHRMRSPGPIRQVPVGASGAGPYAITNGGKWDVKTARNSVEFTHTLSEPSIGYGYVYTKVVRLTPDKPQMTISHVMKNTGSKPIKNACSSSIISEAHW